MRDSQKTRKQLISELNEARQQLEMLAAAEVDRKQAGQELKQSEEKFYKAFLSSPDMIIITSIKDGKYIEVNESFTRVTGYSREELIGHTIDEFNMFVNPEEQQRMTRLLQERGNVKNEEFTFRIRSGEIRVWLCSAEIINIDGDTCMIAVAADITEMKKMEQALRESESKLIMAYRSSPQAIAITTLKDGRFIEVNESHMRLTGFTREELIGHTGRELNTWANPADRQRIIKKLTEAGRIINEGLEFRTKTGERQYMLFSAEIMNIGGEECMISSSTDVTDWKKMEEALRKSEEKFSKAFRASPGGLIITTVSDGTYLEVNDTFLRAFGFTREELIGHTSLELGIWANPTDRRKMVRELTRVGRISNKEYRLRTKSGDTRIHLFSAEQIEFDSEPCVLAVTLDITDYKRMETQALEAENLREVDRLRTEFLSNVSHELRTPLASIKGFSTMLLDYDKRLTTTEKREYLETIDKNTDRLVELIEQLLEMSRLGVGMLKINKTLTDIVGLCQTSISEARVRSPEHNFVLDAPRKLPFINVDDRRIRQVLDNMIDNAGKYSKPGTEITLSARKVGMNILFSVADHGVGIPQKDLPKLFHRIFRDSRRQKPEVPGAGLGLSICKGLIEAHGGSFWIESKEGSGTTCYFTLPIDSPPAKNRTAKSSDVPTYGG